MTHTALALALASRPDDATIAVLQRLAERHRAGAVVFHRHVSAMLDIADVARQRPLTLRQLDYVRGVLSQRCHAAMAALTLHELEADEPAFVTARPAGPALQPTGRT